MKKILSNFGYLWVPLGIFNPMELQAAAALVCKNGGNCFRRKNCFFWEKKTFGLDNICTVAAWIRLQNVRMYLLLLDLLINLLTVKNYLLYIDGQTLKNLLTVMGFFFCNIRL